jgi:hypothetical protein
MTDAENEHYEMFMLQRTDYPVVPDAIPPEFAQRALKSCSDFSWIVQFFDAPAEKL